MQRIRLLLVDDHSLFREGLAHLLTSEPDFDMVAQCGTATEGIEVLSRSAVDVVLLDFDLGGEQGNQFISSARQSGYAGRILMVTADMSAKEASVALKLGASGILLKNSTSPSILAKAVRLVAQGELWVDQKVIQQMADALQGNQHGLPRTFTQREDQVLRGVFEGLKNKEIAANIGVSVDLVKARLKQLFVKTGARTRSQLVLIALQESFHVRSKRLMPMPPKKVRRGK
jgi:DNA-binding NarL/FixJ family response regulator